MASCEPRRRRKTGTGPDLNIIPDDSDRVQRLHLPVGKDRAAEKLAVREHYRACGRERTVGPTVDRVEKVGIRSVVDRGKRPVSARMAIKS